MAIIIGDGFDETLEGTAADDEIYGLAGNDQLYGYDGVDTLYGGADGDEIFGGNGNDLIVQTNDGSLNLIDGGADDDTLDLSGSSAGWIIDMGSGSATSGTTQLQITNVEILIGSNFDDSIVARSDTIRIDAGDGNDTLVGADNGGYISLYGGAGDDTLYLSNGDDLLFGGSGSNTFLFTDAAGTYVNDFIFGTGSADDTMVFEAQANGDSFDLNGIEIGGVEGLTFAAVGSNMDVTVELDADELTLTGTELANDVLVTGNDAAGSTETILIDLAATSGTEDEIDLSGWQFADWGGQGETVQIVGSSRNETITGTSQNDIIEGGDGADIIYGGDGNDRLSYSGLTGASLYGGAGDDTLIGSGTSSQDLLFGGSGSNTFLFTDAAGTYVNDFIFGTGSADDTMVFEAQANGDSFDLNGIEIGGVEGLTFAAVGSNMDVTVELDADELTLTGTELANDVLVTGNDAAGSTETILIDLAATSGTEDEIDLSGWQFADWGGQGETVQIVGSSRNETITGTSQNDIIEGGDGADIIYGGDGNDRLSYSGLTGASLYGGAGDDTLIGS
ncbi:calcium-binding protein, partial [Marimonas lutisalis]|uniref:calcium-binding protein n=1 Tax=Marimonas lutisalis TaxID=2545756 RepID=UPI0010F43725